jgi:peroxiredoxin
MEDDKPEVPTSRYGIGKRDDNYNMDNKCNMRADTSNQTSPIHIQSLPTSRAMDCTTCHIPRYMDADNSIDLSTDDIASLFRKQLPCQRDTTKDNRPYILRKPPAA